MIRFASVAARTPKMDGYNDEDEGQDIELELEVVYSGALPDAIPCRVRSLAEGRRGCCRCGARSGSERGQGRRGIWCTCVVGEVCLKCELDGHGGVPEPRSAGRSVRAIGDREDRGKRTIVAARVRLGDLLLAAKKPLYKVGHCHDGAWGCGGRDRAARLDEARFGAL